jgi:hypothetical protein
MWYGLAKAKRGSCYLTDLSRAVWHYQGDYRQGRSVCGQFVVLGASHTVKGSCTPSVGSVCEECQKLLDVDAPIGLSADRS